MMEGAAPGQTPGRVGPYQIIRQLGAGGMGVVYLGQEETSGQLAAVKLIRPELAADEEFRARLRREVAALQRIPRFCTAPVLAADTEAEPAWIATEYIEAPTLAVLLAEQGGRLQGAPLEALAVGVAVALRALHQHGVIHRDLKPSNILMSVVGPRVIDFGIARMADAAAAAQLTRTGDLMGTLAYLAPELMEGKPATTAADVYSWGCVVTLAATGHLPFSGDMGSLPVIAGTPPDVGDLEEPLRGAVLASLARDPAARPTAAALVDRLMAGVPQVATQVMEAAPVAPEAAVTYPTAQAFAPGAAPAYPAYPAAPPTAVDYPAASSGAHAPYHGYQGYPGYPGSPATGGPYPGSPAASGSYPGMVQVGPASPGTHPPGQPGYGWPPPPPPGYPPPPQSTGGGNRAWLVALVVVVALVLVGGGATAVALVLRDRPDPNPQVLPTTPAVPTDPAPAPPPPSPPAPPPAPPPNSPTEFSFRLSPTFGSESLSTGFRPDPLTVSMASGGSIDASYLGDSACRGYGAEAPDFRLTWDGSGGLLRFFFVPDEDGKDTGLVVNAPDTSWHCNDDSYGTLNPTVEFTSASSGQYDIWVTTYASAGDFVQGTLHVTELSSVTPPS